MAATISRAFIADLARALSPGAIMTDAALIAEAGRDYWGERGVPGLLVRPAREADVQLLLYAASQAGIPVVTRGAGTNIGIGFRPNPSRILLDMRSMSRIKHIDPDTKLATIEPGLVNTELQAALKPYGLLFSPDPASSSLASIGGNIAENAGGPHCLKYGVTYQHIHSVRAVRSDGTLMTPTATTQGPDLLGLLIGSEGTLAVTTEATVRLREIPAVTRTFLAVFDHAEAATEAVSAIIAAGAVPAALEFFDQAAATMFESAMPSGYPTDAEALLLIDLDGDMAHVAHEMAAIEPLLRTSARVLKRADDPESRAALWKGRIYGARAFQATGKSYLIGDIAVPRQFIPTAYREIRRIAKERGLALIVNGHSGDGNLHPTIFFATDDHGEAASAHDAIIEMAQAALALGGTITGEHGIGEEKRDLMRLRFSPAELAAQREVKAAFDPDELLNPGVLLPEASTQDPALPRFRAWLHGVVRGVSMTSALDGPRVTDSRVTVEPANMTMEVGGEASIADLRAALISAAMPEWSPLAGIPGEMDSVTVCDMLKSAHGYPGLRESLLAIDAVLDDGNAIRFGSAAIKDVAGYDMKRLFLGAMPPGVVYSAVFKIGNQGWLGNTPLAESQS